MLRGIAVLGDSDADEYRADDARGGRYAATTLNWVEQLARYRGLNFGCWGTWPEPRRHGFAFNWARSGATAASLLEAGQHTGAAGQVASGQVSLVFLRIGSNDFLRGRYDEIYSGELGDADLDAKLDAFVANVTTAMDTVLDAGPLAVIVVDVQDPNDWPLAAEFYPRDAGRRRVSRAIATVNARLKSLAEDRGVVLVTSAAITAAGLERIDDQGMLRVGGVAIDIARPGNAPSHLKLADNAGHAGTVASGLLANAWFIEPVNEAFGASIALFSDEELLAMAGLAPQ